MRSELRTGVARLRYVVLGMMRAFMVGMAPGIHYDPESDCERCDACDKTLSFPDDWDGLAWQCRDCGPVAECACGGLFPADQLDEHGCCPKCGVLEQCDGCARFVHPALTVGDGSDGVFCFGCAGNAAVGWVAA